MGTSRIGLLILYCAAAQAQSRLPEGPGKAVVERLCAKCHKLEQVVRVGRTEQEWGEVIESMLTRGLQGSDQELEQAYQYLSKNFPKQPAQGKVNVNRAGAGEIAATLELSAESAAAVVDHREKNGPYKSVDDLKKVPGMDAARLELNKEKLEF